MRSPRAALKPHQVEAIAISRGEAALVERAWTGNQESTGERVRRASKAPRSISEPFGRGYETPFEKFVPYVLSVHHVNGKGWLYVGYLAVQLFQADIRAQKADVFEVRASLFARLSEAAASFLCPGFANTAEKLLNAAGAIVMALASIGFYEQGQARA